MRTVVNNREVYHLWANEAQLAARNSGGSVSFDGATAYSYRAPIGRIVRNDAEERAFLVSTQRWSVTTTKHQSYLRRAIPRSAVVFHFHALNLRHPAALAEYQKRMVVLTGKAQRARTNRPYLLSELADLKIEADEYCRFFGLSESFDAADVTRLLAEHDAALTAVRVRQQAEYVRLEAEQRVKYVLLVKDWLAGGDYLNLINYPDTLLREKDGEVETSRGALVPVYAARRLFCLWSQGRDVVGRRVGHYHVEEATPEQVVIGCHRIVKEEIHRFAAVMGWAA